MHPAHHKGRPQQSRSNGVYLCAIISLAFCLVVTFRYWKAEVSVLVAEKEQLQNEWQKKVSTAQTKEADAQVRLQEQKKQYDFISTELESQTKKVADMQKKIENSSSEYSLLEESKHDVDSKLEKCENEKMEETAKKDKEIESLSLKLKAALQKVDDLVEKQKQAAVEKDSTLAKGSASRRDNSRPSRTGVITGHEDEDEEDEEESLTAARRKSYPERNKKPGTRTAGVTGGRIKPAKVSNVVDPFQLSAPDEPDAKKTDKAGEQEEEEEEEGETEGDNAGKIVFSRGGVDTTKSYKEDEETQMRNSRTGNREGVQAETLSDAVQTEATT